MSEETLDRNLHDFLDGRLSAEERARFEERLRADPALAARAEEYREMGLAIRADADELPPGFYTRARARFEAAHTERGRRGFRWVSWETAGLAAAAAIALAVFLPTWLDRESPLDEALAPRRPNAAEGKAAVPPAEAPREEGGAASGYAVGPAATPNEDDPAGGSKADRPEPAPVVAPALDDDDAARTDALAENRPSAPAAAPAPRAQGRSEAREGRGKLEATAASAEERFAPAPPAGAMQEPADTGVAEAQEQPASGESGERDRQLAEDAELAAKAEPFTSVALRREVVKPNEVQMVEDLEALRKPKVAGDEAQEAETKDEKKERQKRSSVEVRWILIGSRDAPFSCTGMRFSTDDDGWLIVLGAPAPDRPAAPFGCAVALPRDGRAVRVAGP